MAETVQKTILDIETSQSVKSVKELKQQIKDLKDRILELNAAGEDATKETTALGNAMHQMKELNEQARLSSQDLGDQLAVASGAVQGMAGAVSTVTGLMSMMGVETDKSTKLLKTMASAMSITSGIQAMEKGVKSVVSLGKGFITATKGAKTLGGALKAAFSSNPIGLLVIAVTALATAIGAAATKSKELEENLKEAGEAELNNIKNYNSTIMEGVIEDAKRIRRMSETELEEFVKSAKIAETAVVTSLNIQAGKYGELTEEEVKRYFGLVDNIEKEYENRIQGKMKFAANNLMILFSVYGEEMETWTEKQLADYNKKVHKYLKEAASLATEEQNTLLTYMQGIRKNASKTLEVYPEIMDRISKYQEGYYKAVKEYNEVAEEPYKREEAAAEKRKAEAEKRQKEQKEAYDKMAARAKQWLQSQKQNIESELQLEQAKTKRLYDLNVQELDRQFNEREISEEEYNTKTLELDKKYYKDSETQFRDYISKMEALVAEAGNPKNKYSKYLKDDIDSIFTPLDLEQAKQSIDDILRNAIAAKREYNEKSAELALNKKEIENTIALQKRLSEIESQYLAERLKKEEEYENRRWYRKKEENLRNIELLELEQAQENSRYETEKQNIENELSLVKERYDKGLLNLLEFNEQTASLNRDNESNERKHQETLFNIMKETTEQRKLMVEKGFAYAQSISESISSFLDSWAESLGEDNEDYKGLKIASVTIDMLSGAYNALVGTAKSMGGTPWGWAAGAVAAAAVAAQGITTIQKILAVDPKGKNSSTASSSAVQTFTTPQQATIATGATNDYTDIMGNSIAENTKSQKVVVLLNDIDNAQQRKTQVVSSNTY